MQVIAGGSRTSSDSFASYRTPLHADFLLAHSTVAGYYRWVYSSIAEQIYLQWFSSSWRNTASGSWFIQVMRSYHIRRHCRYAGPCSRIKVNINPHPNSQVLGWALMTNGQSQDLLTILAKVRSSWFILSYSGVMSSILENQTTSLDLKSGNLEFQWIYYCAASQI